MRFRVELPKRLLVEADLDQVFWSLDSLFGRLRDLWLRKPYAAVAVSRVVAQTAARLAAERYEATEDTIALAIELTKTEARYLTKVWEEICDNIESKIAHYEELLETGQAYSRASVERRIKAMQVIEELLAQIVEQYTAR